MNATATVVKKTVVESVAVQMSLEDAAALFRLVGSTAAEGKTGRMVNRLYDALRPVFVAAGSGQVCCKATALTDQMVDETVASVRL